MRCNHFLSTLVVLSAMIAVPALAQPAQAPSGGATVVRAYNVSDLVRMGRDYPLDGRAAIALNSTGRGGGGELFGGEAPGTPVPVATNPFLTPLARLITETIEPSSWIGEGAGKVSGLGTTLVIRQTADNHNRIEQLLVELRRAAGPAQIVTVRTTWISCAPREIPDPKAEVTAEWLAKQKVYCESQITCFSGQTVNITTGSNRQFVTDLTPVVATGAVAFDPTIASILSGVTLQITPQLVPGTESVVLDAQSNVTEGAIDPTPHSVSITGRMELGGGGGASQVTGNIDRVSIMAQQFKTTARIPLRKKVIVGGMTLEPSSAGQKDGRQLYLVVEIDAPK